MWCTGCILPSEVLGVIGVAEVTWVQYVDIALMDDLYGVVATLLAGLRKKESQLSV